MDVKKLVHDTQPLVRPTHSLASPSRLSVFPAAASNSSLCDNGLAGVQDHDTDVCCPLVCGDACGGEGCGSIAGVDATQCCATPIIASGAYCADTLEAPCIVEYGES